MFKLFGSNSKENENFFLEFDDVSETPSAPPAQPEAPVAVVAPVEEKKREPAPEPVKEEVPVATETVAPTEESAKPAKKTKTKKAKAQKAEAPTPQAAPAPAVPAPPAPKKEPEPVVLFAPNYLMPTPTNARRRPSANMKGFLDMARDMKRR